MKDCFLHVCASGLRVWFCLTWADLTRVCKSGQRFYSQKKTKTATTQFNYDKAWMLRFQRCLNIICVCVSGGESCRRSAGFWHGSGVSAAGCLCCTQGQIHPQISRWDSTILYDCLSTLIKLQNVTLESIWAEMVLFDLLLNWEKLSRTMT